MVLYCLGVLFGLDHSRHTLPSAQASPAQSSQGWYWLSRMPCAVSRCMSFATVPRWGTPLLGPATRFRFGFRIRNFHHRSDVLHWLKCLNCWLAMTICMQLLVIWESESIPDDLILHDDVHRIHKTDDDFVPPAIAISSTWLSLRGTYYLWCAICPIE